MRRFICVLLVFVAAVSAARVLLPPAKIEQKLKASDIPQWVDVSAACHDVYAEADRVGKF